MVARVGRVKSITARTLWGIETILCQNAFDLDDMSEEEEQLYYKRMESQFKCFFDRFSSLRKGEEVRD